MTRLDLGDGLRLLSQVMTEEHFGHESHLRFARALLDEAASVERAEHVANLAIRHVTEIGGNPGKYNCTVQHDVVRPVSGPYNLRFGFQPPNTTTTSRPVGPSTTETPVRS